MNTSPASGAAAQPVRVRRHCLERPFFVLATLVTLALLAAALTVSAFREETAQWLQEDAIKEFRENNPEDAKLSDREILRMLPADTRDDIKTVRELEWWLVALAPLGLLALFIWNIGQIYGTARADGIQVTTRQFPQVHALWTEMAGQLGFKKVPELYVQNGNGTLNAYATCVPGYRAFGVIYSDILERALANEDEKILRFILGHELGHIRLKHVAWWYLLLTSMANLPGVNYLVGEPLSRAREYGCDRLGYELSGDRECRALLMLAAGKHLYRQVDFGAYEDEQLRVHSRWASLHNFCIDHPVITWRIAALREGRDGDLFWHSAYREKDPDAA